MAASFSNVLSVPYHIVGNQKKTVTDVTMDSSYLTGGEAATAANLGLSFIDNAAAQVTVAANASDALGNAQFVRSSGITGLVKLYDPDVPADVTSGDNLTDCVVRVTAYGN